MAAKPKPLPAPTVPQLVAIIEAYNLARTNELKVVPLPFPVGYKNPLVDNLYDAAQMAAHLLKPALTVDLTINPRQ